MLTTHLRERYVQRSNKKYNHIQNCKTEECTQCKQLKSEIRGKVIYEKQKIDEELHKRIAEAEEDCSCLNNTSFMEWYQEKYGYDKRFKFLTDKKLLFIIVEDKSRKVVVTCVSAKTHLAGKSHISKPKFNKIKKESKLNDI